MASPMPELRFSSKYKPLFDMPKGVRYVVMTGGRGSGKSFALSAAMATRAQMDKGWKILYTRYTITSAADSIIPEFTEKVELMGLSDGFSLTQKDITHTGTGSELLFRGIKTSSGNQTAKLKSLQGVNAWVLDEAEELDDEDAFDTIDLSVRDGRHQNLVILCLNPSHKKHWMYRRFFIDAGVAPGFNGVKDGVLYIHTTYEDNTRNLPPSYLAIAEKLKGTNRIKWDHIWAGAWLDEMAGALWTWNMINDYRADKMGLPEAERIAVAVDPAVTNTKSSDETGIVSGFRGVDGHYYVLDDASLKASPLTWAQAASKQYRLHRADRVIGEVNNGGDLVEITLRQVDREIPFKAVHASRGKIIRAEPIAALYEQGLVHHVGTFADMETEMMTFTGSSKDASPNRLDALVWLLSELSGGKGRPFVSCEDEADEQPEECDPANADYDDPAAWQ
jgi:hypothetical protein